MELWVDVHLFQWRNQDNRRIAIGGGVARSELNREPVVRPVAELFYDRTGFGAGLRHVGIIARQCPRGLWRHSPNPLPRRAQEPAAVPPPSAGVVDARLW